MRSRAAAGLLLSLLMMTVAPVQVVAAIATPPTGLWKTIDDKTGKEKALIEISEHDGELRGRIVHLFDPSEPDPVCDECEGRREDQPIVGMQILWGLQREGDAWSGGHILDPENGKIYRARLQVTDGGQSLEVRGFIGISLLGRTQTWQRRAADAQP